MKTEKKEGSRAKDGKKAGQEEKKSFSFGKLFYNNKFVAVFSVLCALAIWFSMAFTNTEEFPVPIRGVPVTIKIPEAAQAEGLRCFSPQTLSVTVYIKGNSLSVRNVTADNIGLETQITETISGAKTYLATISSSKKGYVTDYEIDRIEPSIVQLTLDYSEEKTFTIDTSGVNSSAADGYFVGSVAAAPETITVSGPKSVVDSISAVTVGNKELGELSETARQTSDLILLDANGNTISRDKYDQLSLSTETAEITVPVYVRKTVPFTANFTNAPSGIDLDSSFVTLSPSTVELAGTEEDFASYRSIQLNPIDFSQISPDTSVFDIPVTLPAFFRNLQEIDEVTVSLNLAGYTTKTITASNFKINNLSHSYEAEVTTSSLDVVVVGPEEELSNLTENNLVVQVDMSQSQGFTGHTEMPATISISGSSRCWAYGSYKVNLSVTERTS